MKENIIRIKNLTWIDIEKPTRNKLEKLKDQYNFHQLDVEDVLTYTQRPKIERYDNYLFLILRFPVYNKKERNFNISEIDLFVGKNYFISIHRGDVEPVMSFIKNCRLEGKSNKECLKDPGHLLYNITKNLFLACFPMIDHISDDIDNIEDNIFQGKEKEMVEEIMIVKRNIITLRRIIGPHKLVMKTLEIINHSFWDRKMQIYFSDVTDYVERIWAVLENQRESIISLENTNETLISHKSSEIVRTLTIFSAILLPLTLIASIYGMNMRPMPFLSHPQSFWIIIGIMVVIGTIFLLYFKRKKWL